MMKQIMLLARILSSSLVSSTYLPSNLATSSSPYMKYPNHVNLSWFACRCSKVIGSADELAASSSSNNNEPFWSHYKMMSAIIYCCMLLLSRMKELLSKLRTKTACMGHGWGLFITKKSRHWGKNKLHICKHRLTFMRLWIWKCPG